MFKKATFLAVAAGFCAAMSSCSIILPVAATSNSVGAKMGESKALVIFHFLYFGADASIYSAAKKGGISKISTVDMKQEDYLGIVQFYTTRVSGD